MRLGAVIAVIATTSGLVTTLPPTAIALSPPVTIRVHVWGQANFDRVESYPADRQDTGCTLTRNYALAGRPHTYTYTVATNQAGHHIHGDTFYLTVNPFHPGQTAYHGSGSGRIQIFTVARGRSAVVSAFRGIPHLHLHFTLAPDLRSGAATALNGMADFGGVVGLRASMSVRWSCPVLFRQHYG